MSSAARANRADEKLGSHLQFHSLARQQNHARALLAGRLNPIYRSIRRHGFLCRDLEDRKDRDDAAKASLRIHMRRFSRSDRHTRRRKQATRLLRSGRSFGVHWLRRDHVGQQHGRAVFEREALALHFALLIHFKIGPVTLVSAVFGDITSEMWLWSLNTVYVAQRPALQSSSRRVSAKAMIFGGSSSATDKKIGNFELTSPGRFERANCVAGSTGSALPLPPPLAAKPFPSPPLAAAAAAAPAAPPHGPNPPCTGLGVAGRMSNAGGDMKTTPFNPTPFAPHKSECPT